MVLLKSVNMYIERGKNDCGFWKCFILVLVNYYFIIVRFVRGIEILNIVILVMDGSVYVNFD